MLFLHQTANAQRGKVSNGVSWGLSALLSSPLGFGFWVGSGSLHVWLAWCCGASCKHALAGGSFIILDATYPVRETRGNRGDYHPSQIPRNTVWIMGTLYLRVHHEGVQVATPNTNVRELTTIHQPGSSGQGLGQTRHLEVSLLVPISC